jgi:hypothetical protein
MAGKVSDYRIVLAVHPLAGHHRFEVTERRARTPPSTHILPQYLIFSISIPGHLVP